MEIIVIGAGSVGMLVSSFLAQANKKVKLFCRNEKQKELLNRNGLVRKNLDGSIMTNQIEICNSPLEISRDALVIIAVKYVHLNEVYEMLKGLHNDTTLLFLQNGLAHLDEAKSLPQKSIAFGSCQFGAEKENDYTVVHRGFGILKIALERGKGEVLEVLSDCSNNDFQVTFEKDAEKMLFEKALLNCFINPLTAILKVNNGKLIEDPNNYKLLEILYEELMEAFPEERNQFPFDIVVSLCKRTAQNTSSMLADMRNKRPTEIKTIVGAVINKAVQRGKSLPTLQSLYLLVLSMEGSGEKM